MSKVRDVMTPGCECVSEHDSVVAAARKMAELNIGAMPICGDDNRLKGMLTDRDIVVQVVGAGQDPKTTEVGRFASQSVSVIHADDEIETALGLMADRQIRRLPVIDEDKNLVGIVSQADMAANVDHRQTGELVESISAS
jgi:CBS domain-containing protein